MAVFGSFGVPSWSLTLQGEGPRNVGLSLAAPWKCLPFPRHFLPHLKWGHSKTPTSLWVWEPVGYGL